jgi:3-hydroxyacyl-CoA dehydrogenase, C-terminal domain
VAAQRPGVDGDRRDRAGGWRRRRLKEDGRARWDAETDGGEGFNNLFVDSASPGAKPGGVRVDFAAHAAALGCFGLRLPAMGPLENADYVGLDLVLAVHENVFPSLCRDTEPSPMLRELVARKHLGAKTGAGFSEWPAGRRDEATARLDRHLLVELSMSADADV